MSCGCCCCLLIIAIPLIWFSGTFGLISGLFSGLYSIISGIFSIAFSFIGHVIFSQWIWTILVFIWNIILYGLIQNVALPLAIFAPYGFFLMKAVDQLDRAKGQEGYDKQLDKAISRTKKIYLIFLAIVAFHAVVFALGYYISFIRDSYVQSIAACLSLSFSAINILGVKGRRSRTDEIQDIANFIALSCVFYFSYVYIL